MDSTSDVGQFGIVPLWLIRTGVSARAIQLFALIGGAWTDRTTNSAHPSRATMARELGCSEASMDRALVELQQAQAVTVTPRFAEGRQIANLYRLRYSRPTSAEGGDRGLPPPTGSRAAPLGITGDEQNQNHDPESEEPETVSFGDGTATVRLRPSLRSWETDEDAPPPTAPGEKHDGPERVRDGPPGFSERMGSILVHLPESARRDDATVAEAKLIARNYSLADILAAQEAVRQQGLVGGKRLWPYPSRLIPHLPRAAPVDPVLERMRKEGRIVED